MRQAHPTTFTAINGGRKVFAMRAMRRQALIAIVFLSAVMLAGIAIDLVLP